MIGNDGSCTQVELLQKGLETLWFLEGGREGHWVEQVFGCHRFARRENVVWVVVTATYSTSGRNR